MKYLTGRIDYLVRCLGFVEANSKWILNSADSQNKKFLQTQNFTFQACNAQAPSSAIVGFNLHHVCMEIGIDVFRLLTSSAL